MEKKQFSFYGDNEILFYLSLIKFLLLVFFAGNYGLFRDEFYYIACSKHLSFGYVDQPPLSIWLLAISRTIFGDSILGIRIFAYIAGSATVFISGLIARELGGSKYAQFMAALSVIFCGVVLGTSNYFSMNSFDIFFSSVTFLLLIRMIKNDDKKMWIPIGVMFGIGLQNKLSFLFLGFGLAIALILTRQRKYYLTKELYIGSAIAALIFLPNIIWQIVNHFPTLEFIHNAAERKNLPMSPLEFFTGSLSELNPLYIIFLLGAFYFLFVNKDGRKFALICWMYILIFVVFVFNNGKPYYMGILYPMIIAAGVVGVDVLIEKYLRNWMRYALPVILLPSFIITAVMAVPILNVDTYISFTRYLGEKPAQSERSKLGVLPQFWADRFGWKEMAKEVADVYSGLSIEERKNVIIFAGNYGEAGAIDYFGKQFNLPRAYSPHNNYWFWGPPKNWNGKIAIIIGGSESDYEKSFEFVELAAKHYNKYGMPYENVNIFICRNYKRNISDVWLKIKNFI